MGSCQAKGGCKSSGRGVKGDVGSHQAEGGCKERSVESRVVELSSRGRGVGPPQLHGLSERSWGQKTGAERKRGGTSSAAWVVQAESGAERKRGKRGAEFRREAEGKRSGEEETSDGAKIYGRRGRGTFFVITKNYG